MSGGLEVWQHAWRCDGKLAITTDNHHLLANTSASQLDLFRHLNIQPLTNSRLRKLVA